MRNGSGIPVGTASHKPVRMGGGGYVIGGGISNDGLTKVVNMDVFNAYIWGQSDSQWRQAFTTTSLPVADYDPKPVQGALVDGSGSFAINVAPTDKTKICAGWNGYFYFSSDTGNSWTRGTLAAKRQLANSGASRYWNDKIACHPTSTSTWLLGTNNDGVYYTTDFGTTISAVSGTIPANSTSGGKETPYLVAFDPTNGNKAYIFVQGTGLYSSTTTGAAGTFTAVASSPTWCSHMFADAAGIIWVVNPNGTAGAAISKWNGTAWSQPAAYVTDVPAHTIAVNPLNTLKIVVMSTNTAGIISVDGGATWINSDRWFTNRPVTNGMYIDGSGVNGVPWLTGGSIFSGKIFFNPAVSNELWGTNGLGVTVSTPPTTFVQWIFTDKSRGIEELVANNGISVPGSAYPIFGCWDKPVWLGRSLNAFTETYRSTTPAAGINHCWQFDYAADDTSYVGSAMGFGSDASGYSTTDKTVWTQYFPGGFPSGQTGGNGGAIAINAKAQQIIVPGNNQRAICTTDTWATWNYLPIDPNISGFGNWINANYNRRNLVTADKTRAGVFAIIMNNTQGSNQGLWVTTTGPMGTWSKIVSGRLDSQGDPGDFYSCTLAYIPGKSGELLYTTQTAASWTTNRLLHYTSDGASGPNYKGGLTGVKLFGFGAKASASQDYPTIYVIGTVGGVSGLYRTIDFFTTMVLLARFPNNSVDNPSGLFGDMNIFGRVYIGYAGSAWVYGDFIDTASAT